MTIAHKIAEHLLKIQAVKLNPREPFTWASGLRSPIYCDNRKVLSYPSIRNDVLDGFVNASENFRGVNAIAGVATAGIAWGALLADRLQLPFCYVRSKPKEHGLKNRLEGTLVPESKVLVVEDLISTGGSSLEACEALKGESLQVIGVIAIFEYGFTSTQQNFNEKSIPFRSLSHFSALLERALIDKIIEQNEYETLKHWNLDPVAWSTKFQSEQASL